MKYRFLIAILSVQLVVACDSSQQDKQTVSKEEAKPEVVKEIAEESAPVVVAAEKPVVEKVAEVKTEKTGEQVYKQSCIGCHASGAANAPKLGDAAAWKARIAKGKDALYTSALKGVPGTAMMAKGTCVACSDTELKSAVDYMLSKVN